MQKSLKSTLLIIFFILLYIIISNFTLVYKINTIYLYIINPLFWILLSVLLKFTFYNGKSYSKIAKETKQYMIIGGLAYIIINLLVGLFVSFGNSPYNKSFMGIIINIWIFATVLVSKEYIRNKVIQNVYNRYKILIAILISIVYVVADIFSSFLLTSNITIAIVIKKMFEIIIPSIVQNMLFSYIALNSDYKASIIYILIINLYKWLTPIIPKTSWMMSCIIEISIPIVIYIYIQYIRTKNEKYKTKRDLLSTNPKSTIPVVAIIILAMWFAFGVFPIKPVAVASGSMNPVFNIGDIIFVRQVDIKEINVGDIIQYNTNEKTIIHRVISKKEENGKINFITKGDNNNTQDKETVNSDQIIGKYIGHIKYLGYPAVWLNLVQTSID